MPDRRDGSRALPGADHWVEAHLGRERDPLVDGIDRPAGHPGRDQLAEPVGRRTAGQSLDQHRPQQVAVSRAVLVVRESRVRCQVRDPEHLAQLAELPVVACGHDEVAVAGGQRLVGVQARMGVAHPERDHPSSRVRAGLVDHPGHRGGQQAGLDVLTLAGSGAVVQRRQDADRGMQAGDDIEDRDTGPERWAVRIAGQAHQARHRLHHQVVTRQVPAATRAEAADRGVHDAGVAGPDRLVVEPEPGQAAGLEVLHQHVGPAGKLPRGGQITGVIEVQGHGPLVPVDRQVIRRHPGAGGRRRPAPGVVSSRALHLDHVRAEVGEQHRAVGAGQHPGEIGDQQPGQRARTGCGLTHRQRCTLLSAGRTLVRIPASVGPVRSRVNTRAP